VIGDVKRGDIGSTSSAYAAAHLGDPPYDEHEDTKSPDAITISAFMGMDTIEPFVKTARDDGKGFETEATADGHGLASMKQRAAGLNGKLEITKTPNGENPLVHGGTPILGVDVWEHSYYIDYRNARPKYLEAFVDNLINWDYVLECYEKATKRA